MEIPERLHELVDQLGQALVQALASDPASRSLARAIQGEGFEVTLMLEAIVALHKREEESEAEMLEGPAGQASELEAAPEARRPLTQSERPSSQWSEEDRAFLRTFKISLD
jgi:hypothetical protein